ncbi:MAG: hypothetical protein IJH20_02945 [Bacilli bacterium]|nr:hypothetical protein [Bacilli bacterium]
MENKKSGKGLVICLTIFMLVFAACAVLLFTGVIKSPMVKCEDKTTEKTSTKTDDDTKKSSTTEKTVDERYKDYLNNLANEIKEKSKFDDGTLEADLPGIVNSTYDFESKMYTVSINKNLELTFTGNGYSNYKIADNVVLYNRIFYGNGGYSNIYYITTDGKIHMSNMEAVAFLGKEPNITDVDKKNIVNIIQGSSSAGFPIFIDIEGNVYTN